MEAKAYLGLSSRPAAHPDEIRRQERRRIENAIGLTRQELVELEAQLASFDEAKP